MERTSLLKRRKTKMEDNIFLFIPNLIGKASIASTHIELVGCKLSLAGQPYFFWSPDTGKVRLARRLGWVSEREIVSDMNSGTCL